MGAFEALPWAAAALARTLPPADLLVDATSAGLDEAAERRIPASIPLDLLPAGALVYSLIYHRRPGLLVDAAARGLATLDGAEMLIHQAAASFSLFTGVDAPIQAMRDSVSRPTEPT
jgi:shikimate dehydrogenase